jgi:hypothetical protein
MRIYKTWHKHALTGIESWFIGIGVPEFIGGADCHDLFIAHDDRAVRDDAKRTEGVSALRAACEGKELGSRMDKHGVI